MQHSTGPIHRAQLRINHGALAHNYDYFSKICKTETAAVVKANGYGLGATNCANTLCDMGARSFFVAHLAEAIELRNAINKEIQIYVLNGFFENETSYYTDYKLKPIINTLDQFHIWQKDMQHQECAIHIDTGMNRLGLSLGEFEENIAAINANNVGLVISHLACSSDKTHPLNQSQLSYFKDIAAQTPNSKHSLAASAGAILGSEFHFDMSRIGIGLYGCNPLDEGESPLRAVAHLSAPIIQIRHLIANESIGYGATFTAPDNMQIAIVALGYADGFLRSASNKGFGFYNGIVCPIVGRVSMDLIAINISNLPAMPKIGAHIEFLGDNANIDSQATAMNTIGYEILTRLGSRFEIINE